MRFILKFFIYRIKMSDIGSARSSDGEDDNSTYSDDAVHSDDSNFNGGQPDIIWLTPSEYDSSLPALFNSSSRRTKDINSLFSHLSDRIYRCKEFPGGIYINEDGQLCPDDERSGIYKRLDIKKVCKSTPDDPVVPSSHSRKYDEEDGDEDDEGEDEDTSSDEEDDEDDNDEDTSVKRVRGDDDDDEDYVEEEESTDEESSDSDSASETEKPKEKNVETNEKPDLLEHLKKGTEDQSFLHDLERNRRLQRINKQQLLRLIEKWDEQWTMLRKQAFRRQVAQPNKRRRNESIEMSYEPNIMLAEIPTCEFEFKKPTRGTIKAGMNCDLKEIVCQCEESFKDLKKLYTHLETRHFSSDSK